MDDWQMIVLVAAYAACWVPALLDHLDRSLAEPELVCPHCGGQGDVRRNCRWERPAHRSLVCYGCLTAWFAPAGPRPEAPAPV